MDIFDWMGIATGTVGSDASTVQSSTDLHGYDVTALSTPGDPLPSDGYAMDTASGLSEVPGLVGTQVSGTIPLLQNGFTWEMSLLIGTLGEEPVGGELPIGLTGPDAVVMSNGTVVPIPAGADGPNPVANGLGIQYNGGAGGNGLADNVTDVRIMDPTTDYPNGYANYGSRQADGGWQTVNPYTGQSVPPSSPWWHIPLGP